MVFLVLVFGFFSETGFVKRAKAQYYGGCYVCAWDNNGQRYACKMTDGAGGAFCGTTGGGEGCWLRFVCYPAN